MSAPLPSAGTDFAGIRLDEFVRGSDAHAVFRGTDGLGLSVQLSVVRASALGGDAGTGAFLARVRTLAQLQHEALLPFVSGGRSGEFLYAVAKNDDAPGLDELLGRGGALAVGRVLAIGSSVAGALAALEAVGARHGNLTPRRILLPGRGAVLLRPARLLPASLAPRRARYQSPEEARGEEGDIRSDLFVLGLILAEAAAGRYPIAGSSESVTRALAAESIPSIGSFLTQPDPALRVVLGLLLAPDPSQRYATAAAAADALAQMIDPGAAPAATPARPAAPQATVVPAPPAAPPRSPAPPRAAAATPPADRAPTPLPPETAPIGDVIPVAEPLPPEADAPQEIKRTPGRLFVTARLGEALLEIDEDVHLGRPEGAVDVQSRADAFEGAVLRVLRERRGDVVEPLTQGVTVNGAEIHTATELKDGDTLSAPGLDARYERSVRLAFRASGAGDAARHPHTVAAVALAAAISAVVLVAALTMVASGNRNARAAKEKARAADADLRKAREVAPGPDIPAATGTGDPAVEKETAARLALDAAQRFARANPDQFAEVEKRFDEVVTRHPETAYAVLAAIARDDLARRRRLAAEAEVDRLIETAEERAAAGELDDAVLTLRKFAEEHIDTVAAERARRTMVKLESVIRARFDTDSATLEAAIAARDWPSADATVARMLSYVPWSLKDATLALKAKLEASRNELLNAGSTPPPVVDDGGVSDAGEQPKPPPVVDRDKSAMDAFKRARGFMQAGKDLEALDGLLAFMADWKGTEPYVKYADEARARITSLAARPAGVMRLFRGVVEERDKGRFRISYDFENEEQLLDFRDENAFEAPPRAAWKCVSGAMQAKGSGAFVLDAKFDQEFLTVSVKVSPQRAHDLGVAFFEHDDLQRFYLFTLQNSFFALGKGPDAKPFAENAIVLFGRDMWRDTAPGLIGFVRKCGSDAPEVKPGESLSIKVAKADDEVWMRFPGGRTIRGSASGDKPYTFHGLEPAVFVLNSSGFFDEFVVEGVPDPEWVAQRWQERISKL